VCYRRTNRHKEKLDEPNATHAIWCSQKIKETACSSHLIIGAQSHTGNYRNLMKFKAIGELPCCAWSRCCGARRVRGHMSWTILLTGSPYLGHEWEYELTIVNIECEKKLKDVKALQLWLLTFPEVINTVSGGESISRTSQLHGLLRKTLRLAPDASGAE